MKRVAGHPLLELNHCSNQLELGIRFAKWCEKLGRVPEAAEIQVHFGTSRATSFRWRNSWCSANGILPPTTMHLLVGVKTKIETNKQVKKNAGYRMTAHAHRACLNCDAFRARAGGAYWADCTRHKLPVRQHATCMNFLPSISPRVPSANPAATGQATPQRPVRKP